MIIFIHDLYNGLKAAFLRRVFNYQYEPMMKQRERRLMEELLRRLKPKHVLEWGSGYSTLYYPGLLPRNSTWTAIEHHKGWSEKVKRQNNRKNVKILHVRADKKLPKAQITNMPEAFVTYSKHPLSLKKKFDFILIDGRARKQCFQVAKKIVSARGVIMIHDANRSKYYGDEKFKSGHVALFLDGGNHGGIFLYSKHLSKYLNIAKHMKVFNYYKKLGKGFAGKFILRAS